MMRLRWVVRSVYRAVLVGGHSDGHMVSERTSEKTLQISHALEVNIKGTIWSEWADVPEVFEPEEPHSHVPPTGEINGTG